MEFPNFVICGHCGTLNRSAIQMRGNYGNMLIADNFQGCNACGKMFALPAGIFSSAKAATLALAAVENPIEQIAALTAALKKISESEAPNSQSVQSALQASGLIQAEAVAATAPVSPRDKRIWAASLLAAISYAWESLPAGALSWMELFSKIHEAWGQ